mmetsp:Transcript_14686/g.50137  ORF Transcript_14686/g.50137 Transcript_14686/m.50137 type:complete len:89 (+) Transcript_14686:653-919(+)
MLDIRRRREKEISAPHGCCVLLVPCLRSNDVLQDELILPLPGKFMIRGDSISMVSELKNDDDWKFDPLPRLFAYAASRNEALEKLKKS